MKFTNTDINVCNECKGNYKIRLLTIGNNEIALCMDCRTKLYEVLDEEDTLVVYNR